MFQTEINHFLQSFDHSFVVWLMQAVSTLGYTSFLIPFSVVLLFSVDFRKGFIAIHVLVMSSVTIGWLKQLFYLPRPLFVDATLKSYEAGFVPPMPNLPNGGSNSFWGLIPSQTLSQLPELAVNDNGMPSGHVGMATALWLTLGSLFKNKRMWVLAIAVVGLMPVSRMFLARHFLADVLVGFLVGMIFFLVTKQYLVRPFFEGNSQLLIKWEGVSAVRIIWLGYLVLLPIGLFFIDFIPVQVPAAILALNLVFLRGAAQGFPVSEGSGFYAVGRAALAIALYLFVKFSIESIWLAEGRVADFFQQLVIFLALWLGGSELMLFLGWWKREGR